MPFRSTGVIAALVLSVAAVIFIQIEWGIAGSYPGDEFFELAAQTIPILLVALAVEAQARRFDYSEAGKSLRIAAVILLGAGETTAVLISAGLLHPELGSTMSKVFVVVTAAGMLGGFIGVLWVALAPSPKQSGGKKSLQPYPEKNATEVALPSVTSPRAAQLPTLIAAALFSALATALLQRRR